MTPIGSNPTVLLRESFIDARRDRLLPVVEVTEPSDRARLVLVVAGNLHSTHGVHCFEVIEQF